MADAIKNIKNGKTWCAATIKTHPNPQMADDM